MTDQLSRRRARSSFEDENEADAVRLADRSPSQASDAMKRLRLRGGGREDDESDEDGAEYGDESDEEDDSAQRARRKPKWEEEEEGDEEAAAGEHRANGHAASRVNGRSKSEFQPGAILSVRVKNFVTYQYAEFFPGPNLNMVIGPNGTGKSSLVCAICLGLGYHYSVLGRATNFGDYVKRGEPDATVQIELQKRPQDARNWVVRLHINGEDSKRTFWINKKEAGIKAVQSLMRDLRIQIDNLCQFLPQEKVADFAGLSSIELLDRTMQAVASPEMLDQQKRLKELYQQQKESLRTLEDGAEQLKGLEARQEALQADVDKIKEREEVQRQVQEYEDALVVLEYMTARDVYHQAKSEKKETERALKRLERSSAPSLEAVNRKQDYRAEIKNVVEARKQALRRAEASTDAIIRDIEGAESKLQQIANEEEAEQRLMDEKKKEIRLLNQKITSLRAEHKRGSNGFDAADWNRKIREQEHLQRESQNKAGEITDILQRIKADGSSKFQERNGIAKELRELDSQAGQLLTQLKKIRPDVAKGWIWLKENQNEFQQQVFGPPMLSCSVKDQRYSDLIQSGLRNDDFLCFTAQTRDDHRKLSDQFYNKMGLSVTIRTCQTPYSSFKSPLSRAQVADLGFDGFSVDYLEGPEPVLAMLCAESFLHKTLVGLNPISDANYARISSNEAISVFVAGPQSYKITRRREYGAAGISTSVMDVARGRYWSDQPLDASEKQELERKLSEVESEIEDLKKHMEEKKTEKDLLTDETKEISQKIEEIRTQKQELQKEFNIWRTLPDKIDATERMLEQKQAGIEEIKERRRGFADRKDQATLEKLDAIIAHSRSIGDTYKSYQAVLEAETRLIEAESDLEYLKTKNVDITQKLDEARAKFQELAAKMDQLRQAAHVSLEKAQQVLTEGDKERLEELGRGKTVEELQWDINAEKSKLDLIQASNPHAMQEYEKRAGEIERLKQRKERLDDDLASLLSEIEQIRHSWEPRVDNLIERINEAFAYNFEQINCAGEVGILKEEDFEKWAIEIRVRFRENETMQRLDKQRQSGGERAVSTVFYLMSLQSMAQAPFRVVDEINQGMDPRNERMVHERMVDIACNEHTSQYFLITPKLLRGLRYDPRMKVHCIASGEHMPEQGAKKMSFANFAKIQRSLVASTA